MAAIGDTGQARSSGMDRDVAELHKLGYARELRRRMGGFSNFAVSLTIISVLSGCLTLYFYGMQEGARSYYWSAKLDKSQPGAWSWFTGWFNLLGQVAVTAGIDYGFAFYFTRSSHPSSGTRSTTPHHRRRGPSVLGHLLAGVGTEMVHGPEAPRNRGGVGPHRRGVLTHRAAARGGRLTSPTTPCGDDVRRCDTRGTRPSGGSHPQL